MTSVEWKGNLVERLAYLKKVPVSKVLRNAGRDFVYAAQKATPTAVKSKSEFYTFIRPQNQKRVYVHEGAEDIPKLRRRLKKAGTSLRKVLIRKGWSRYSWLQAASMLGVVLRYAKPTRITHHAAELSKAMQLTGETISKLEILDKIHFDKRPEAESTILQAGYRNAAQNIVKTVAREEEYLWKHQQSSIATS